MYFALSYNTVPSQYTTVQYNVCLYIYVYLCLYMYFDNTFYYHILIILALPYNLSTLQYSIICHICVVVSVHTHVYILIILALPYNTVPSQYTTVCIICHICVVVSVHAHVYILIILALP